VGLVGPEPLRADRATGAPVYRDSFSDEHGQPVEGMPEMHVTIRFIDLGNGRTNLINTTQFASLEDLETGAGIGMDEGWASSLANLETYLATDPG
jgi:uncharacterized protein YndB with AHSA1/START domain